MKSTHALIAATLVVSACGKNPGAYQTADAAAATQTLDDPAAVRAEAEALWAERVDEAKLRQSLELYEKLAAHDPSDRDALARLNRGWYFLGDSHLTDKQAKIDTWATAIEWGKACLALNQDFADRVNGGEKPKDAVAATTKDEVPCMYWTASAIGKWGKIQGIAKALGNLPTVKAYISRVEELEPKYFYYGPARYWGAYYSVLPSFAGQDLEKSAAYFEASINGAPEYLPTRGLRAENLAVKNQDLQMFMDDLQYILDFDVTSVPDLQPENTLEQRKAQALLDMKAELFDKKTIEAYESGAN